MFKLLKDHIVNEDTMAQLAKRHGRLIPQNWKQEKVVKIANVYGDNPEQRGHKTCNALPPHTDRGSLVLMACAKQCSIGGFTKFAKFEYIYEYLLRNNPEVLPYLYDGFYLGMQDEDVISTYRIPVIYKVDGNPAVFFVEPYIRRGAYLSGIKLSEGEEHAIKVLNKVYEMFRFSIRLEPGQVLIWDNKKYLHSRDAFTPESERLLYRVWIDDKPKLRKDMKDFICPEKYGNGMRLVE